MKQEIEEILDFLKKRGYSRREIEQDLGYKEKSIDQGLSRGGNEDLLAKLRFYKKYALLKATMEGNIGSVVNEEGPYHDLYIDSLKEQKRILEVQNDFLRRNFETSLNSIAETQHVATSQLKALSWYQAVIANQGDEQKAEEAVVKINNKAAWYGGASATTDTGGGSGKKNRESK